MTSKFAPKCRTLTATETSASFDIWKENLLFNLTIDGSFEEFLEDEYTWGRKSVLNRGLTATLDNDNKVKQSAKQKAALLQLMLGSIASYAPVISRQSIVSDALCLNDIWARLRTHYGFRKTGSLILDLPTLTLTPGTPSESYESLWERFHAFITDNLLTTTDNIRHCGVQPRENEELSPTLLSVTVVLWLRAIHPGLPNLVKQKYAPELRNNTIASMREEISESLDSLVAELCTDNVSVMRSYSANPRRPSSSSQRSSKFCALCDANNRPYNHFLSECLFLPEADKKFIKGKRGARTRIVEAEEEGEEEEEEDVHEEPTAAVKNRRSVSGNIATRKIDVIKSPVLRAERNGHPVKLTIDSGAETDLMKKACAEKLNIKIHPTKSTASQADGEAPLKIVGEVHCEFTRGKHKLTFNGLVAEDLSDEILCGMPFQEYNDVYARPSKKTIYIGEDAIPFEPEDNQIKPVQRGCKATILRITRETVLLPNDSLQVLAPPEFQKDTMVALEPRYNSPSINHDKYSMQWLKPQISDVSEGVVHITNSSDSPILLKRHEQIATIRPVIHVDQTSSSESRHESPETVLPSESIDYKSIKVDPDNLLTENERRKFHELHEKYKEVFDSRSIGCYNGKSGPLQVTINMGPTLPPQRKGRMPLYSRTMMEEQQRICDELEGTVLVKPEDVNVTVEYLNPSFLIKKPSGKKRLVTAFGEVGQYSKPQPAYMPDTNQVLRHIGNWKYIIKGDLTYAYWQMKLNKASMKYCGIATPFKGIRVYARGAMGMPGTETALEELMCRVLGSYLYEGHATKIADDLYVGGDTPAEALEVWEKVLESLFENGLKLSAAKTECCPASTTILGWLWSQGTLKASPHRVSALATVERPKTVRQLRGYIGGYKTFSRVIEAYCDVLSPLEEMAAGKESSEKVTWNDSCSNAFNLSQQRLHDLKTLTMPRRCDHLQIVTDASQMKMGLAAALYVVRDGKSLVAGYFNTKYRPHQRGWIPCELEALAISAAVSHFAPYLVNSEHQTCVLTDSLPCVQAYAKLCQGKFSSSARVSTFLSVISRFQVKLIHLKGSDNIYSDFASRNPPDCNQQNCQICKYASELADSVVRACSVTEVLNSGTTVPYSSRSGWSELQHSCDSLRRACAHLKQGTTPSKKSTKIRDVKRYLQVAKVSRDGLLVVEVQKPSMPKQELIVVPRRYIHGLVECLHIKLSHPSRAQLRKVFNRAFYGLDVDSVLDDVTKSCHMCTSLSDMPNNFLGQTSTSHPEQVGSMFAADVVRRAGQCILLVREYISSITHARLITDERADTLRSGVLIACSEMFSRYGPKSTVKVDPASSFRSLVGDQVLKSNNIQLELGREKYVNKNPVAERAIRELHAEMNRVHNDDGKITPATLALAVANLNSRIRESGLSSLEMYTQRDQFTGNQLPLEDRTLILRKEEEKMKSHGPSAKFKSRGKVNPVFPHIKKGDLIYINSDRMKTKARDRYIVVSVEKSICVVQKFVGTQLRARQYTVNRADVIVIPSWKFPLADQDSDSDESIPPADNKELDTQRETTDVSDEDESEASDRDEVFDDRVVQEDPVQEVQPQPRRSTRTRRRPAYLSEYVVEPESD